MPAGLRTSLVVVLAVLAAGGAVVVVARAFGWGAGPLYFLVALTPYVGCGLLVVAIAAAVLRAWWLAVPPLLLALVVGYWWLPAFRGQPSSDHWDLRVMTSNLQFGQGDPEAIVAAVRQERVDLLAVEELTPEAVAGLQAAGLDDVLPHHLVRADQRASGTGIWSRLPLRDRRETSGLVFENLAAEVVTAHGPVTFFAVHPIAPALLDGDQGRDVAAAVAGFVGKAQGPVIVAGDLNATTDNLPVRNLESMGFVDAATAAGAGLVRTWPTDLPPLPPLVAIDHVMTRDAPTAVSVTIVAIPGTDHRALVAAL